MFISCPNILNLLSSSSGAGALGGGLQYGGRVRSEGEEGRPSAADHGIVAPFQAPWRVLRAAAGAVQTPARGAQGQGGHAQGGQGAG